MSHHDDIDRPELERRILLATLSLAVRLCCRLGLPLKDLVGHVRIAYLRELRQQGLSLAECAQRLEVSERTAKTLAKELRESFELPDTQHTLPTKIEFMLWRTPMSQARLHQVLRDHSHKELDEAIALLVEQERIRLDREPATPVYIPTQSVNSQLSPEWIKRIGGLSSLLDNLYHTIDQRFFEEAPPVEDESPPEESSFARTLSFYVAQGKFELLQKLFWEVVVPQISTIDQDSHKAPKAWPVKLTMFWAREPQDNDEP